MKIEKKKHVRVKSRNKRDSGLKNYLSPWYCPYKNCAFSGSDRCEICIPYDTHCDYYNSKQGVQYYGK